MKFDVRCNDCDKKLNKALLDSKLKALKLKFKHIDEYYCEKVKLIYSSKARET